MQKKKERIIHSFCRRLLTTYAFLSDSLTNPHETGAAKEADVASHEVARQSP
jgi:hypothetical protein